MPLFDFLAPRSSIAADRSRRLTHNVCARMHCQAPAPLILIRTSLPEAGKTFAGVGARPMAGQEAFPRLSASLNQARADHATDIVVALILGDAEARVAALNSFEAASRAVYHGSPHSQRKSHGTVRR